MLMAEIKKKDTLFETCQITTGPFVYRGGVKIAKFAVLRDKSRDWRSSAINPDIDNSPRHIAMSSLSRDKSCRGDTRLTQLKLNVRTLDGYNLVKTNREISCFREQKF